MMVTTRKTMRWLIAAALLSVTSWGLEPAEWAVKDAPIRFVVELSRAPSHPNAGYFVTLPDGGNLPGPYPELVVLDESGASLTSAVLWFCQETACGLVFQAPKAGKRVVIYARGSKTLTTWTPASGLTPSCIRCEANVTSTKAAALKLSDFGRIDAKSLFVNQSWTAGSWQGNYVPMAIKGWRPGEGVLYLLAYVDVKNPGPTWVAPLSRSGRMVIAVDGKEVPFSRRSDKLCGEGGEVNLSAGLHRVELYGYDPAGRTLGPMMFMWRTPKTTVEELGGVRPSDLRYPGTPMCEAGAIDDSQVVKSGACTLLDVQPRSGLLAMIELVPGSLFALEGEEPLIAYTLKAGTEGNPKETRYRWRFEDAPNAVTEGVETYWLFPNKRYGKVTLTAEADGKQASSSMTAYFYTTQSSSLDDEETRQIFKRACYVMLQAYPDNADPTVSWNDSMLNNFFRVQELSGSNLLIEYIVTQRWRFFKKRLTPERQALLEDIFLLTLGPRKPQEAVRWAYKLGADELSGARAAMLKLKGAEVLMYELDDLEGARKIIAPLLLDSGEAGEWAKIRMGDWEFLSHNLNGAIQRYGDVQNRAKASVAPVAPKRLSSLTASSSRAAKGKDGGRDKKNARNDKDAKRAVPLAQPSDLSPWKLSAIRDVAASENVNLLIEQGFYLEAFQALQVWERTFPMSKISGDYILCEAKLYRALKHYKRARKILSAYCEQVDISNFLPEAMELNRLCMIDMKEPAEAIKKYQEEIRKRALFGNASEE